MAKIVGNLNGCSTVVEKFQIGATCYVGQIMAADRAVAGGAVYPSVAAAAGPDTAMAIVGVCESVITSPTFNSTYNGDTATYDTTQALQVANDPVGPCLVKVGLITPSTLVQFPVVLTTIGTAPNRQVCSTTVANGLTYVLTTAITTTNSGYSTGYCSIGANKGQYRKITTGAVQTQTVLIAYTYQINAGDTFVTVNMTKGACHFDLDSQIQGINSAGAGTNYFKGFCTNLILDTAGQEKAVLTINATHLAIGAVN